ncbi:MAG TPA: helix-turn-helix domain-containing protein [Desulfobulbus sp.]|nr:helix-turn-helix domain-containing protein [Desulfobulbus sp.]
MGTKIKKELNLVHVTSKLTELGWSQSKLATEIGVTRETVSKWFKKKKFPRPAKLLKLAKILSLSFDDIVLKIDVSEDPVVAFRKKGGHKISEDYLEAAKDKGFLLEQLVPYLPYDCQTRPPSLINPNDKYEYVHRAAKRVRNEINGTNSSVIEFSDLIRFFNQHHAVIIPVLWGNKKNHENALHVFLPSSMTTWIYLNLDSKIHDFKFWMAHELGHVKTPDLRGDEAEDFAESFAGALLVPGELAEKEYIHLRRIASPPRQVARIKELAEKLVVSPLTIYIEINKAAMRLEKPPINLEKDRAIYKVNTHFCSQYQSIAEALFDEIPPAPKDYISCAESSFHSPFFGALSTLIVEQKKSVGFLQAILDLPPADAHLLYDELS